MSEVRDDALLLGLLLDSSTTTTTKELERELDWPAYRTQDALAELRRAGLAHIQGDLAFASRAARRYSELDIC